MFIKYNFPSICDGIFSILPYFFLIIIKKKKLKCRIMMVWKKHFNIMGADSISVYGRSRSEIAQKRLIFENLFMRIFLWFWISSFCRKQFIFIEILFSHVLSLEKILQRKIVDFNTKDYCVAERTRKKWAKLRKTN